jgi:hypothetical protein
MRTRSTWTKPEGSETPRQAATQRKADIYTMNQDHPQPSATEYESGDPDAWAETPTTNKNVEAEYEGDHVKRNELGFGEFRDDTWKHKDSEKWNDGKKYDNSKTAAERKASAAGRIARALLRTEDAELVREAAVDLMALPDAILASTMKRLDKVSPDALPQHAKNRRAYACVKLAARLLGDAATEPSVESLAKTFMTVDDPTLKSIISSVASAQAERNKRLAAEGDEEEKDDKTAQVQSTAAPEGDEEDKDDTTAQVDATAQMDETAQVDATASPEGEDDGGEDDGSAEAHGLSPQEMGLLDDMLTQEMGGAPAPAGGDADLMSIFTQPAPAAPAPMAPPAAACPPVGMPMAASDAGGLDVGGISFEDDDDAEAAAPVQLASVADLFSDDPEVQAQRQIRQAHHEQVQRVAAGYQGIGRTASAGGAKKVGKVQPDKASAAQQLEALWDRPGL